jgi:hypothetical protein
MSCPYLLLDAIKVVMARCNEIVVDKTIGLLQLGAIRVVVVRCHGVVVIGRHEDSSGYVPWRSCG